MANQPEQIQYDAGIYQLESTDPVDGGAGAVSNKPLLGLSNRTAYLKKHVDDIESGATVPQGLAKLDSPAFTGTPTAPTQAVGDNSKKLANTEFAQRLVNGMISVDVAGGASVTLTQTQYGFPIIRFTGALTADIAVIFPGQSGRWQIINNTSGGFTLTCKTAAGAGIAVRQGRTSNIYCDGSACALQQTDFDSPVLTGTPLAPTPIPLDSSGRLATTDFVKGSGLTFSSVSTFNSSRTLNSSYVGGLVIITGAGALTITLPSAASVRAGDTITIRSNTTSSATNTIKAASGESIGGAFGGSQNSTLLRGFDTVVLVSDGSQIWTVASDATYAMVAQQFAFQQSFGVNGFQKLPGGMIVQWGTVNANNMTSVTINYPIAFPNAFLGMVQSIYNDTNGSTDDARRTTSSTPLTTMTFKITNPDGGTSVSWFAYGR